MTLPSSASASRPSALAWLAFGFAAIFFSYAFVQRVSPSVMVADLMRDFAVGGALLGNLSAFYFYSYAGLQIPVGVLLDRFGPRRLMTGAALLCAVGSIVFALSGSIFGAYLGRLLIGAGCAVSFVGALAIATTRFPPRRFAMLTGIAQMGGMVGAVLGAAPTAALVGAIGWRDTMLVAGVVAGALAVGLWFTAKGSGRSRSSAGLLHGLRIVATNPQTWLAAGFGFFITGPMLAFSGLWAVPYMTTIYGLDRPSAAAAVSLTFVGWGVGAPLVGALSDRLGRRRPIMLAGSAGSVLVMLAVIYLPSLPVWAVSALFFLLGAISCCMLLNFACAKEHNPNWAAGAAIGFANTAVMASGALLQPLIGWLLDLGWTGDMADGARVYAPETWRLSLAIFPASCALAVLMAWLLREPPRPGATV